MLDVKQFHGGGFSANTYLVRDPASGEAMVVDPACDPKLIGVTDGIRYVFVTHAHFDHILFLDRFAALPGVTVLIGVGDAAALRDPLLNGFYLFLGEKRSFDCNFTALHDGDIVKLGDNILKVIETPGHTPGSVSLYGDGKLFSGDLIFSGGGYGRTDLPGGDESAIHISLKKILRLPDACEIYPGHGEITSVRREKSYII